VDHPPVLVDGEPHAEAGAQLGVPPGEQGSGRRDRDDPADSAPDDQDRERPIGLDGIAEADPVGGQPRKRAVKIPDGQAARAATTGMADSLGETISRAVGPSSGLRLQTLRWTPAMAAPDPFRHSGACPELSRVCTASWLVADAADWVSRPINQGWLVPRMSILCPE